MADAQEDSSWNARGSSNPHEPSKESTPVAPEPTGIYEFGPYRLNAVALLTRDGEPVALSPTSLGEEVIVNDISNTNNITMDEQGRLWMTATVNTVENPAYCAGSKVFETALPQDFLLLINAAAKHRVARAQTSCSTTPYKHRLRPRAFASPGVVRSAST